MPVVKCRICAKKFYAKPFWIRRGYGKYCSASCQHQGQKNGKVVQCHICSKNAYKPRKALRHSKSKKYFCSKSCQTIWRNSQVFIGVKHPNWKSGEFAYRTVLRRNKVPAVCGLCQTKDGRILATHHIDKNRKNNKLDNLAWLCHNCHFLVHHYAIEKKRFMETLV